MFKFFMKLFIVSFIMLIIVQLSLIFPEMTQEIGITGGIITHAIIMGL